MSLVCLLPKLLKQTRGTASWVTGQMRTEQMPQPTPKQGTPGMVPHSCPQLSLPGSQVNTSCPLVHTGFTHAVQHP